MVRSLLAIYPLSRDGEAAGGTGGRLKTHPTVLVTQVTPLETPDLSLMGIFWILWVGLWFC